MKVLLFFGTVTLTSYLRVLLLCVYTVTFLYKECFFFCRCLHKDTHEFVLAMFEKLLLCAGKFVYYTCFMRTLSEYVLIRFSVKRRENLSTQYHVITCYIILFTFALIGRQCLYDIVFSQHERQ